jgi:thioredoxin-disulfide reductase
MGEVLSASRGFMSKLIDEKAKNELMPVLATLVNPVKIVFFTQKNACPGCAAQEELLRDLSALSNKLTLEVYDFVLNGDQAMNYKVDKIPATAIIGERDYNIRFYGLTAGYEFASLLEAIIMVSSEKSDLDPQLEELVRGIKEPVHMQVMVTLTCPYCPNMVHVAHQFAFINNKIRADMVEASEFPQISQKYKVTGVPKTIINESYSFEGALPAPATYLEIVKAVNPEEYKKIEEEIRKAQGTRKAKEAEETHEYDVIIVGGGPAAMSAAIYAARKGLDIALIAKKLGGQINYTAIIENYLGFPGISGADMTELFRNHMERQPIAEAIDINATKIEKENNDFIVTTENGKHFKSRAMIYCAGKEYKRLGVPGEEQFIGHGIGFCATCDAPLYKGKRVAVVGGGNSAFTSVRDLINFASEIHLIHRKTEFRADASLIQDVKAAKNVVFHTPIEVRAFLGTDKLTGISLESADGKEKFDLLVDGVFLEIGLIPNSSPLRDLMQLSDSNEIPVNPDQSTKIKGLFAAGDVTIVEEKQISVAVGQGALAALTAYKYLIENRLISIQEKTKEAWE